MQRFNDVVGVLRGFKFVSDVFIKDFKSNYGVKSVPGICKSVNSIDAKGTLKTVLNLPISMNENASLIAFEVRTIMKHMFQRKPEVNDFEPEKRNEHLVETKSKLQVDQDPIDRQLIEEYRQQYLNKFNHEDKNKVQVNNMEMHKQPVINTAHESVKIQPLTVGKERKVPSSEIGRAVSFASLFARMGAGAIAESTRRKLGVESDSTNKQSHNVFLSEANVKRLVDSLCRVRGAALKLGQILSIQDSEFVSPRFQEILERVRQNADFMPVKQMRSVMQKEFGNDWMGKFSEFDEKPFAAASIGQVHRGRTLDGVEVAVKIQYPGVKRSIDSDINNLMGLLQFTKALPTGLYADKAIEVAKKELAWECDYRREAHFSTIFEEKFKNDSVFVVPKVISQLSSEQVLTTELVDGVPVDKCQSLDQDLRDWVGTHILRLCLTELFVLRTMQTDPNWSNFLINIDQKKIYLLDFGASQEYDKRFVDSYLRIIKAASTQNSQQILHYSRDIGFLTGFETKIMEQAHINAVSVLGEVFTSTKPFDFGTQATTRKIKELIPVMLEHRLTPPPEPTYSIHRKLSGGFLLCTKLKSRVSCRNMFNEIYKNYKFD